MKEGDEITGIKGVLLYRNEYEVSVMMDSRIAAERYAGEKPLVLSDREVYFAEDEESRYAYYEENGEKYLLETEKQDLEQRKQFVEMIKNIL